ncbi:MAG TPA: class I SAM-dependent methyltransferase [Saprospiraceae bacterium]|nr:class I SAM-dependent methyltransferase [Saprospiraceae bacterium]
MNTDIVSYYKDRANEYEKIYSKPERQEDLKSAASILQEIFAGKQVLEIACGTGYWTEKIAATATSIFATDINESVIDIAKKKKLSSKQVSFAIADIYNFSDHNKFASLFGGFIWSHILLQDLNKFLSFVNSLVSPGSTVVFIDNNFVEGSNHPISERDEQGNSFQTRKLEDNTTHLVLKNFPTEKFLQLKLKDIGAEFKFFNLTYYWIICYTTKTNNNNE